MLRSSSSSLFALWSICENEGWRGRWGWWAFCEWEEGLTSGARRGKGWTTHHPCVLLDRLMCSIIPSNKVMSFEDLSVLPRSSWTIRQVRSNYPTKFDGA
jgi:hypothetical protein